MPGYGATGKIYLPPRYPVDNTGFSTIGNSSMLVIAALSGIAVWPCGSFIVANGASELQAHDWL